VHGVDVEGKMMGLEEELVRMLGQVILFVMFFWIFFLSGLEQELARMLCEVIVC